MMSALLTLLTHEYKSIFLLSWVPRRIFSSIDLDKDVETTVNCTRDISEEAQRAISSLLAKDHVITEHILDETIVVTQPLSFLHVDQLNLKGFAQRIKPL